MAKIIKEQVPFKGGVEERISKFALYTFGYWAVLKVLINFRAFSEELLNFMGLIYSLLFGYVVYLIIQAVAEYFAIYKNKAGYKTFLKPTEPKYMTVETCSDCQNPIGTLSYNTRSCQFCDEKLEMD